MPRLYLIRHTLPQPRDSGDTDPPLAPEGVATGSDRVGTFKPGHASVTIVDEDRGRFVLTRLGAEAETQLTSG